MLLGLTKTSATQPKVLIPFRLHYGGPSRKISSTNVSKAGIPTALLFLCVPLLPFFPRNSKPQRLRYRPTVLRFYSPFSLAHSAIPTWLLPQTPRPTLEISVGRSQRDTIFLKTLPHLPKRKYRDGDVSGFDSQRLFSQLLLSQYQTLLGKGSRKDGERKETFRRNFCPRRSRRFPPPFPPLAQLNLYSYSH